MKEPRRRLMKRLISLVGTIILASTATSAWAGSYTVRRGDTLSKIAQRELGGPIYGSDGSLSRLAELNPVLMSRPDFLKPGQTIDLGDDRGALAAKTEAMPEAKTEASEGGTVTHVVRRGDTLTSIAQQYYTGRVYGLDGTLRILLSLNSELSEPGQDFHRIRPGQALVIRGGKDAWAETVARAPVGYKSNFKSSFKKDFKKTARVETHKEASRSAASVSAVEVDAGDQPWVAPVNPAVPPARLVGPVSASSASGNESKMANRVPAKVRDEYRENLSEFEKQEARTRSSSEHEALRHLSNGQSLYKGAKYSEALEKFRQARQLNPEPVASWIYEIKTLQMLERDQEARELATDLVKDRPHLKKLKAITTVLGN